MSGLSAISRRTRTAGIAAIAGLIAGCAALAGCAAPTQTPTPLPPLPPAPTGSATEPEAATGPVQPAGTPTDVTTGLDLPWSIAFTADGVALISERDTALVKEVAPDGSVREVGRVPDVVPGGEGGLLGLAIPEAASASATYLYAYTTAESDNRIVRMPLAGVAGSYSLGAPEVVLSGIRKAGNHNGGRIKFGPDGMLYATTGDAGTLSSSQDPESLNGKILRMTPDGGVPTDNPTPGSLVYSLGHRNPQGIAWDADGQLWAAEFGQNTWDEFNRITPGANYGWPVVEGIGDDPAYVNPAYQWATSEASPSGLAFTRDTFFLAALRGERVWAIYADGGPTAVPYLQGQYGRIRDIAPAPDGSIWILTSNTGRDQLREGDDRIVKVQLAPVIAG